MYLTTVYASAIAAFIGTAYYAVSIIRGKFSPPLSAFIILSASFGIAWFLYTKTPDWSWTSNIGLVVAMINVWAIALTIFFVLCFKKTVLVSFDNTQKWTLAAAFGILLLWAGTDNPFL